LHASKITPRFRASRISAFTLKEKDAKTIENAQAVLDASKAVIIHDQIDRNYYSPKTDEIHLTPKHSYDKLGEYYSIALPELSHWTGHEKRLNRPFINSFGSDGYALEELRAEIGSFMLCQELNVDFNPANAASYVASWSKQLTDNTGEIIKAARDAEKIKDFCLAFTQSRAHTENNDPPIKRR
jgi:putative DNA primase/helicase